VRSQGGFAVVVAVLVAAGAAHADTLRIVDRPLTLDRGHVGAYLDFDWEGAYRTPYRRDMRTFFMPPGSHWVGTRYTTLALGYGISDELTVAGQYVGGNKIRSAAYDPFTDQLDLERSYDVTATIFAEYRLAYADRYSAAATASVVQELDPNLSGIGVGITARYRLTHRIAVFTGANPIAPANSTKLFFRNDGRKLVSAAAGFEIQWMRRFYTNFLVDSTYNFSDSSYRVVLDFQMLFTITRNIDVGAFMGEYDLGLATYITL